MTLEVPTPADLKRARFDAGLTQGELADRIDMSQAMLSRIENDDVDPTLSTVRKIAEAIPDN
jgi:predicted transcriptional regulator